MGKCPNKLGTGQSLELQRPLRAVLACSCVLHKNTELAFPWWWLSLCWGRCLPISSLTLLTWPWCLTTRRGIAARATAALIRATGAVEHRGRATGGSPVAWCVSGTPLTPGRGTGLRTSTRPSRRCGHSSPRNRWTGNSPKSRRCAWRPAISPTWPTCSWSGTVERTASRV